MDHKNEYKDTLARIIMAQGKKIRELGDTPTPWFYNSDARTFLRISTNPTPQSLKYAFEDLNCKESGFSTENQFMEYMQGSKLHYFPILVINGDTVEALIWFDGYDTQHRTCKAHFITARKIDNPVAVARFVRSLLDSVLDNGDIDALLGFVPVDKPRALGIVKLMGFKEFASMPAHVATVKTA